MEINTQKNKFVIYACFSRSFDENHIKSKKIHLISSIIGFFEESHIKIMEFISRDEEETSSKLEQLEKYGYNIHYIFMVMDDDEFEITFNHLRGSDFFKDYLRNGYKVVQTRLNFRIIVLNIDKLIGSLSFSDYGSTLFESIFGNKILNQKDFDNIYQNSLFIFNNIL
jgi:hypothetical protein